jgi:DNA polymerase III delta subunit
VAEKSANSLIVKIEGSKYSIAGACALVCTSQIRTDNALSGLHEALGTGWSKLTFSLEKSPTIQLLENLNTRELFTPKRFFVIKEVAALKNTDIDKVVTATKNDPSLLVVFVSPKLASKAALRNHTDLTLIELPDLTGHSLAKWSVSLFRTTGLQGATEPVIQHLIQHANGDPDTIAHLIEQVYLYCEKSETVTLEILAELFQSKTKIDEFKFIEIIAQGSPPKIIYFISLLEMQGTNPFGTVGLLFRGFSQLHRIAALSQQRLSMSEVARTVGQPQWLVEKQSRIVSSFKKSSFKEELECILQAGLRLRSKSLSTTDVLNTLALKLMPKKSL